MITTKNLKITYSKTWINSKGKKVKKKPNVCLGAWITVETFYGETYYSVCNLLSSLYVNSPRSIEEMEKALVQNILNQINKRGK